MFEKIKSAVHHQSLIYILQQHQKAVEKKDGALMDKTIKMLNQNYKKSVMNINSSNSQTVRQFTNNTTVACHIFEHNTDLLSSEKIINFFYEKMNPYKSEEYVRTILSIMQSVKYHNTLMQSIINNTTAENQELQNFLYASMQKPTVESLGDMILYQAALGNTQRAKEYLQVLYEKNGKNSDLIKRQLIDNYAQYDNPKITGYTSLVSEFIKQTKPKVSP